MPKIESPFRYPGGKTQFYDFVFSLIQLNQPVKTYIEPFAGGAGIPLKLIKNNVVDNIWINDFDPSIYSVWYHILNSPKLLISKLIELPFSYKNRIDDTELLINFWRKQKEIYLKEKNNPVSFDGAFATLFLNRTNRSGIISGGPIGGYHQASNTKLYDRLNIDALVKKIKFISSNKDRIKLTNIDAIELIREIRRSTDKDNSFIFFDPPYYCQGKNLYFSSLDNHGHEKLAKSIIELSDYKWILTYDNAKPILDFYNTIQQKYLYSLNYTANNKNRGKKEELFFSSPKVNLEFSEISENRYNFIKI